jgi:membrane protein required for colicin V production
MPTFGALSYFDLVIAVLFLIFLIRGLWIGFMRQLAAFFALVGSYYLAGQYAARILPFTERFVDNPKWTFLVSFALIFIVAALVFTFIGKVLHRFMQITLLGWLDRISGLILGGVKAAVVASLLYMFLASSLSSTNELLRKSYSSPYLKQGAEMLQSLIDDPRVRKYFVQKEPAILSDLLPGKSDQKKPVQQKPGQH